MIRLKLFHPVTSAVSKVSKKPKSFSLQVKSDGKSENSQRNKSLRKFWGEKRKYLFASLTFPFNRHEETSTHTIWNLSAASYARNSKSINSSTLSKFEFFGNRGICWMFCGLKIAQVSLINDALKSLGRIKAWLRLLFLYGNWNDPEHISKEKRRDEIQSTIDSRALESW